jgi:hypothetical protein
LILVSRIKKKELNKKANISGLSGYESYSGRNKKNNPYKNLKRICPVCGSDNSADGSKNNNLCVNCNYSLRGVPAQIVLYTPKKK